MAGHGSPAPEDRGAHPGRRVSEWHPGSRESIASRNRIFLAVDEYLKAAGIKGHPRTYRYGPFLDVPRKEK